MDFVVFPVGHPTLDLATEADTAVALIGRHDLDGDGVDDLLLGNPGDDTVAVDAGAVQLFVGDGNSISASAGSSLWGSVADHHFGGSLAVVDDLDGDGLADIIVGAPGDSGGSGAVYLYGSIESAVPYATLFGSTVGGAFGSDLDNGDFDGDGAPDLVVGAPLDGIDEAGAVYVWFGVGISTAGDPDASWSGREPAAHLGTVVTSGGDADGDGDDEIVFSAPGLDGTYGDAGGVFAVWGSNVGLSSTVDWTYARYDDDYQTGAALSHGDFDADGYEDLVVGTSFSYQGGIAVVAGGAGGWNATAYRAWIAGDLYGSGGVALGPAADVNADGYEDAPVWVTSQSASECACHKAAFSGWLLGGTSGLWASSAQPTGGEMAPLGDINGDGIGELAANDRVYLSATDDDGDGFYVGVLDALEDCTDSDAEIHPGHEEKPGDGTDSDCDGLDDDPVSTYSGICPDISTPELAKKYADDFDGSWYPFSSLPADIEAALAATDGLQTDDGGSVPHNDCGSDWHSLTTHPTDGNVEVWRNHGDRTSYFEMDGNCDEYSWDYGTSTYDFTLTNAVAGLLGFRGTVTDPEGDRVSGMVSWSDGSASTVTYEYSASEWIHSDGTVFGQTETRDARLGDCALVASVTDYRNLDGSVVSTLSNATVVWKITDPASAACSALDNPEYALAEASEERFLVWGSDWRFVEGIDADRDGVPAYLDCDDQDAKISPCEAEDLSDSVDNDCDGLAQVDADLDGYASDVDCDDNDPNQHQNDDIFQDSDQDGYGTYWVSDWGCNQDGWASVGGDCDDNEPRNFPGGIEVCDGVDNNCNGTADVDAIDAFLIYPDNDRDQFGAASSEGESGCAEDVGWVRDHTDCDDSDAAIHPGVPDPSGDVRDQNCDGFDPAEHAGTVSDAPSPASSCTGCEAGYSLGPLLAFGLWRRGRRAR